MNDTVAGRFGLVTSTMNVPCLPRWSVSSGWKPSLDASRKHCESVYLAALFASAV